MMKRTKIICTLGPAVDSESALKNLVLAGMDVARCNFSHGSHAEHKARMDRLKKVRVRVAKEAGLPLYLVFSNATLADMARRRPRTLEEFLEVSGVGEVKAEKYGPAFLRALAVYEEGEA